MPTNLHDSTIVKWTAEHSAAFFEWLPYQVFLPMTGDRIMRSLLLLSIGMK
jgi:hypothetical protein